MAGLTGKNRLSGAGDAMMKLQPAIKKETLRMGVGVGLLSLVMLGVFAALGRLDWPVVWGTMLGGGFAALNFFLMALGVQLAAEKMNGVQLPPEPETEDGETPAEKPPLTEEAAARQREMKRIVQRSYYLRLALTIAVAVAAVKIPAVNPVPALIALLFPRIVIALQPLTNKIWKET